MAKNKLEKQVAALPYRRRGKKLEVLLITSRETRRWVIPKGWPMKGKKDWNAAAIEGLEEAGIKGDVGHKSVGTFRYVKRRITGDLDCNFYVFDFIALKNRLRAITDELDHRMMLATANPFIRVEEGPRSVHVTYREREWLFPREDCVLLPIENTTAELLARYIGQRLLADLAEHHGYRPDLLRVEVEENIGQSATYEWRA